MGAIKLPGDVTIRTFSQPPDGFDPVQADMTGNCWPTAIRAARKTQRCSSAGNTC